MKVHNVKKARTPGNCSRCGSVIAIGDPYIWIKSRVSPKRSFCTAHPPKPSDITSSDKLSRLYSVLEELEECAVDTLDEALSLLDAAISTAEEVGDDYQQSLDNMPEGPRSGQPGMEIEEKIQACSDWAAELELARDDINALDDWDEDEVKRILGDVARALEL